MIIPSTRKNYNQISFSPRLVLYISSGLVAFIFYFSDSSAWVLERYTNKERLNTLVSFVHTSKKYILYYIVQIFPNLEHYLSNELYSAFVSDKRVHEPLWFVANQYVSRRQSKGNTRYESNCSCYPTYHLFFIFFWLWHFRLLRCFPMDITNFLK